MAYAENTQVTPERTRAEIERTIARYGCSAFGFGIDGERAVVTFRADRERVVRFEVHTPPLEDFRVAPGRGYRVRSSLQQKAAQEQAIRQRWRALLLVIKAKLEAVETGIVTFEEEFLSHILLPDGSTVGDFMAPQVEIAYAEGTMPSLLPGAQRQLPAGDG